jgi:putative heme-binding domain-containing protein
LSVKGLTRFLDVPEVGLRIAAVRTLAQHPHSERFRQLTNVARDAEQPTRVRAFATAGIADQGSAGVATLVQLVADEHALLRDEALRGLVGAELTRAQKEVLSEVGRQQPQTRQAVARVLFGTPGRRPAPTDVNDWLELLDDSGDARRGELVFFGTKVGMCGRCHRIEGRGNAVGPDLSRISRRVQLEADEGRRWLLQTVLQPSQEMAPQYTPWMIVTTDGKTHVGLPRRKGGSAEAYLGEDGQEFTLKKSQIEFHREMTKSLMPEGLLNLLTLQELNDLLAFVMEPPTSRRTD